MASDVDACRWLHALGVPFLLVATKADKLSQSEKAKLTRSLPAGVRRGAAGRFRRLTRRNGLDELWQRSWRLLDGSVRLTAWLADFRILTTMQYQTLSPHRLAGRRESATAPGAWPAGAARTTPSRCAAMERALALGCNFFDTAWAYGNGPQRAAARPAASRAGAATHIYIATKVPPKNGRWPARADYRLDDVFPPDHIREMTEKSLENLGLDCVDLQQFHVWTDAWADDERWQRAVDDLKREGLIKAFGISVNRWEPANVIKAPRGRASSTASRWSTTSSTRPPRTSCSRCARS